MSSVNWQNKVLAGMLAHCIIDKAPHVCEYGFMHCNNGWYNKKNYNDRRYFNALRVNCICSNPVSGNIHVSLQPTVRTV